MLSVRYEHHASKGYDAVLIQCQLKHYRMLINDAVSNFKVLPHIFLDGSLLYAWRFQIKPTDTHVYVCGEFFVSLAMISASPSTHSVGLHKLV